MALEQKRYDYATCRNVSAISGCETCRQATKNAYKFTKHGAGRYEALEGRMESLRAEKRPARDTPPHIVQRHLEEVAEKERQLTSLQACPSFTAPLVS